MAVEDVRATFLSKHPEVIETMDRMLLGTVRVRASEPHTRALSDIAAALATHRSICHKLLSVYTATVNPRVRQQCVTTLLKLVHFSSADALTETLRDIAFSSFIATLLASPDLAIVVAGLQLAATCLRKLPSIFRGYFRREGVAHEMEQLAKGRAPVVANSPTAQASPAASGSGLNPAVARGTPTRAASTPEGVSPLVDTSTGPTTRSYVEAPAMHTKCHTAG